WDRWTPAGIAAARPPRGPMPGYCTTGVSMPRRRLFFGLRSKPRAPGRSAWCLVP
ncbi:MAG: hypothetical protein AVDCRST_MAG68-5318, partial [uncultured Gemmatimonadetes bacterium]